MSIYIYQISYTKMYVIISKINWNFLNFYEVVVIKVSSIKKKVNSMTKDESKGSPKKTVELRRIY